MLLNLLSYMKIIQSLISELILTFTRIKSLDGKILLSLLKDKS
ncbi:hypothetical protein [Clostridium perfringens]|nr:hypothetical protein [Clostridium perfringens]